MADTKISALTDGASPQAGDQTVVVRAGANRRVQLGTAAGAETGDFEPAFTTLPVAKGGTNSGATLSNNRFITSSGGAIVEAAAIAANRIVYTDVNGLPTGEAGITRSAAGQITLTGGMALPAATAGAPSINFGTSTTGVFAAASDSISFATSGYEVARFSASVGLYIFQGFSLCLLDNQSRVLFGSSLDTAFTRPSAGVIALGSGSVGDVSGTLSLRAVKTNGVAFASLPTGSLGMLATVTDSTTTTLGATISGGGANTVLAYHNGTDWTVAGGSGAASVAVSDEGVPQGSVTTLNFTGGVTASVAGSTATINIPTSSGLTLGAAVALRYQPSN